MRPDVFIKEMLCSMYNRLLLLYKCKAIENYPKVNGIIEIIGKGKISFGGNCIINSGIKENPVGGVKTVLAVNNNGSIKIGNNVGISNATLVSYAEGIEIKDNVRTGGGVRVYDTDFHSINYTDRCFGDDRPKTGKVVIEECAFIGANSILLKGVTIGKNAVIGAGSVVTKNIPSNEIWAGNPARFIKYLGESYGI